MGPTRIGLGRDEVPTGLGPNRRTAASRLRHQVAAQALTALSFRRAGPGAQPGAASFLDLKLKQVGRGRGQEIPKREEESRLVLDGGSPHRPDDGRRVTFGPGVLGSFHTLSLFSKDWEERSGDELDLRGQESLNPGLMQSPNLC